jgi:hypothetical protein
MTEQIDTSRARLFSAARNDWQLDPQLRRPTRTPHLTTIVNASTGAPSTVVIVEANGSQSAIFKQSLPASQPRLVKLSRTAKSTSINSH